MDLEIVTKGKQLSDNDRIILTYLASHVNELEGVSLRKIAATLYTSPATIVRLAQKLEFSGYRIILFSKKSIPATKSTRGGDCRYFDSNRENCAFNPIHEKNLSRKSRKIYYNLCYRFF